MDLNLLKIFIKVADCGSLTKASKLLNHPKSKVSRDLVKLENELEQTLLKRTSRGIYLTEQGFNLIQSTRKQLEELESSLQKVKNETNEIKGHIKLTAPEDLSSFILTRLISEFMNIYPDITIELFSTTEFLDFQEDNIDLAFRIGKLSDSSLIQRKLADIDVIYVCSSFYAKSNLKVRKTSDLKFSSMALFKDPSGSKLNKGRLKGITPIFSSNSMLVLKDFIRRGQGVAAIPKYLCQKEINAKEFEHILPDETFMVRGLYLLSTPSSYTPKHVKVFKDYISDAIKKEL